MKTALLSISRVFQAKRRCSAEHFHSTPGTWRPMSSKREDPEFYERPEGLNVEEQGEWDEMMENPVIHDLFYGMGSSGQSGGERPETLPDEPMTPQEVAMLLKMGSWRVARLAIPQIELIVSQLESCWREILPDMRVAAVKEGEEGLMYMDTMDPKGNRALGYNLPDPEREDPAWPRMQIENRVYESYCFRKLHIEVAIQQDGLQVLHCVMYPRNTFDLPILSLDFVAYKGRPTFAIADPCPVTKNLQLPPQYANSVRALQKKYNVVTNSKVPEWGKSIFSECCVQVRPESPEDVGNFIKYLLALSHFHVQFARLATPVKTIEQKKEIYEAHARYSTMQRVNDKTLSILQKRFGVQRAQDYMSKMMFDVEPFNNAA